MSNASLRSSLAYEPQVLKFGTSGRRGEVVHLTQLEIYINATAELEYLQSLTPAQGGIAKGDEFHFACDLRPSSRFFVPEQAGRGEIAQAICRAIADAGMRPVYLGCIPTPALTCHALAHKRGSMMVTGSHIPFDRNGYKTNSARGELLKKDEAPINARVEQVRRRLYEQPFAQSLFNEHGLFKTGHMDLPPEDRAARDAFLRRYTEFFAGQSLAGRQLLVYQHSAVGRDLLVELLEAFGATVIPAGRSETFVPIDTEAIGAAELATIQDLTIRAWNEHGPIDGVVSIDGDSDRPLVLGVETTVKGTEAGSGKRADDKGTSGQGDKGSRNSGQSAIGNRQSAIPAVRFFGGDLVGMIVAEFLGADAVVVPISCNDAVDRGVLSAIVEPKTRIGSPFVIAGMEAAAERGKKAVCGWEANGGFLTGSNITRNGRTLPALPTRDAFLPILAVLFAAFAGRGKGSGFGIQDSGEKTEQRDEKRDGSLFPPPQSAIRNPPSAIPQHLALNTQHRSAICDLFARLPQRFSRAALLRKFPRPVSLKIVQEFSPTDASIKDLLFTSAAVEARDEQARPIPLPAPTSQQLLQIRSRLSVFFPPALDFTSIARINYIDGVRIFFDNGDIAHVRPSGNADELRIYAVADTQSRADEIARIGTAEPDGILRQIERAVGGT